MKRLVAFGLVVAVAAASACDSDDDAAPPTFVTIQGQVVQGTVPAAGALVYPYDRTQILAANGDASLLPVPVPIIADDTGHFAIYGYGTVYDLTVAPADSPLTFTSVRGLTQRAPVVTLPPIADAPSYTCHIGMAWSAPPPTGATILYFLAGPTYPGVELISVKQTDSNYLDGVDATWRGSYSTSAVLWVVAYTQDAKTGLPTAWNGAAGANVELVDQRETSFFTVLQTTQASTASIAVQPASGYSIDSVNVTLDLGSGTGNTIAQFSGAAASTSPMVVSVPDLPGNRLIARGLAHDGAAISYAVAAPAVAFPSQTTAVQLQFTSASQLTSPSDGATKVDAATPISWQGSGVNELSFVSTTANTPSLTVITSESSIPFGELLTSVGASFPPSANVTWSTRRYTDIGTTDVLEASGFDVSLWRSATSATQTFTVASP